MTLRPSIVTALALALAPAAAAAQPSVAPPAAPPAPGARSDLSQINGVPVKVGEHNEYYYSFRRTNVQINPLGWIVGIFGASASYGVSDHVALRADVTLYDLIDSPVTGLELSVSAPLYLRRTYQGPFLEAGILWREIRSNYEYEAYGCADCRDDTDTVYGPQVLVGWHWMWDGGFNLAVATGAGRNLARDAGGSDDPAFVNGYLRFGYAF
ncbi:MAG: hypothetical protein D6689_22510 [Deltaproteobacteria bacterium]|nr:MAG: hypothetical protein D6689_22510 [Deltaproteobacteria bacterium]